MSTSKYSLRGVSSQKEDVHKAIEKLDKGLFPNAFCKILPDFSGGDKRFCNIMHADTAGTKPIIAYLYWKETGDNSVWKGIIQDALVMNVDDMLCAGAVGNIVVSSTIGRNKHLIPGEVLKHLIEGTAELLEQWNKLGIPIYLAGGETADVGDLIRTVDVGFTAFTRLKQSDVKTVNIQPGDVIVGLASFGKASYEKEYNSGIGCNGLTSARHDVLHHDIYDKYPETYDPSINEELLYCGTKKLTDIDEETGLPVGKLLLSPTRTYFPVIKELLKKKVKMNGIIHCTGGGQSKVMKFVKKMRIIKNNPFAPPPVFKLIRQQSGASWKEMYEVFNMGHRVEIYTDEKNAEKVIEAAKAFKIEAKVIGKTTSARKNELILKDPNGEFITENHA